MKCKRCGRELKNKHSIKVGYGSGCYKKMKQKIQPTLLRFLDG
jgi:protein-arginine kinase activator protein McsA